LVEPAYGLSHAGEQSELLDTAEIPDLFADGTVPIEKYGLPHDDCPLKGVKLAEIRFALNDKIIL
jgi:hypothetical protein